MAFSSFPSSFSSSPSSPFADPFFSAFLISAARSFAFFVMLFPVGPRPVDGFIDHRIRRPSVPDGGYGAVKLVDDAFSFFCFGLGQKLLPRRFGLQLGLLLSFHSDQVPADSGQSAAFSVSTMLFSDTAK